MADGRLTDREIEEGLATLCAPLADDWDSQRELLLEKKAIRYGDLLPRALRALQEARRALKAWDRFAKECEQRNVTVPLWAALLNEQACDLTRLVLDAARKEAERG